MKRRPNQVSQYLTDENVARYKTFRAQFPLIKDTTILNSALRFYLDYAERGVDLTTLKPFTLQNTHQGQDFFVQAGSGGWSKSTVGGFRYDFARSDRRGQHP